MKRAIQNFMHEIDYMVGDSNWQAYKNKSNLARSKPIFIMLDCIII